MIIIVSVTYKLLNLNIFKGIIMAKLYFRYGTVGSAKTLNLLSVAHNYRQQGKDVMLIKPKIDDRFGADQIKSRSGLGVKADIIVDDNTLFSWSDFEGLHCILVDEAQFLSAGVVNQLRDISRGMNIPVICYGLRTDFKTYLFEGSRRLMELSDSIEEVKVTCAFCNRKGIFNLKFVDGKPVKEGESIELGADEKYQPACNQCYHKKLKDYTELS